MMERQVFRRRAWLITSITTCLLKMLRLASLWRGIYSSDFLISLTKRMKFTRWERSTELGKGELSGLPLRLVGTRRWPACLPSLLMPALLKPLWTKTSENLLLWLMNESPNWGTLMTSWRITAVHNFCAGRGRDNTEVEEIHLRRRLVHFLTRNLFPVLFFLPCLCWCSPYQPVLLVWRCHRT